MQSFLKNAGARVSDLLQEQRGRRISMVAITLYLKQSSWAHLQRICLNAVNTGPSSSTSAFLMTGLSLPTNREHHAEVKLIPCHQTPHHDLMLRHGPTWSGAPGHVLHVQLKGCCMIICPSQPVAHIMQRSHRTPCMGRPQHTFTLTYSIAGSHA